MEKHQYLVIVLTMIVGFAASFAYLYRQRIEPPSKPAEAHFVTATPAADPGGEAARPAAAQNPAPSSSAPSPPPAVATNAPMPAVVTDGPPLPVIFTIGIRSVMINDDEGPSRWEKQNDGILFNSSDRRIPITVLEVDLATMETIQAQLVLQPKGAMHFGEDRGLKMADGHQLTLRAAGYQELTQTIP